MTWNPDLSRNRLTSELFKKNIFIQPLWFMEQEGNWFLEKDMNSMKLVIPLHPLYWSIHTKDKSQRRTAFAFIFGVNWLWRCGVTASFRVFLHEIKCNGMTSFMEFMITAVAAESCSVGFSRREDEFRWWKTDSLTWQPHLTAQVTARNDSQKWQHVCHLQKSFWLLLSALK